MAKGKILHKLVIVELVLAICHGTFIFLHGPLYGWYLSVTAIGLNLSYTLHNVIAWFKIKPFLPRWGIWVYLVTLLLAQPYWVLEIYANFVFFNKHDLLFLKTRPLEPLFR
ncbi:hypothetical protein EYZ11_010318 [Aspergillus tanneri]|uniref:Uncharacterized protein n=1 Tax=Aspergillus tanneri TaxID=1220188 RepID=A0A4S3J7S6_9EURO|nr:hypothetical protein EYZ11_010318 [Aspergillus tanneri]